MPISDVNFDKFYSCLSWQVLNKNSGRLTEPVVILNVLGVYVPGGICPRGYMS